MKIAYWIRTGDKYGSMEKYIILLAKKCVERGHEFLLLNEIKNTSITYSKYLNHLAVEQKIVGESHKQPIEVFISIKKIFSEWKPDIVHTNFINPLGLVYLRILGIQLVYFTFHSPNVLPIKLKTRFIRKVTSKFLNRAFAVSHHVRNSQINAGFDPQKIETMYLGLNMKGFMDEAKTNDKQPEGSEDPNKKIIITVGRFFPEKGMKFVVMAAIKVMRKRKDVIWWFVGGDGPESEYCHKLVDESGMQGEIIFLGQRNDVPYLMNKAYIQVVGSLSEGLGLMALEASVLGVPTVGTNISGLNEVIISGETGLLVTPGSPIELAEATMKLLDNQNFRDQLGKNAEKYVKNKFDSKKMINELISIFEEDYKNYH